MTPTVVVLGPQRRPTLDRVVRSLQLEGPFATVTAGWQERESDDGELSSLLDGNAVNLRLYARWFDALGADPDYARGEREHRAVLDELQHLYLLRLDHAVRACKAVQQRIGGHPRTQEMALADAVATVRRIDATHLERVDELHASFEDAWRPGERDAVARHRAELGELLSRVGCLVLAGGHVGELLRLLQVFGIREQLPPRVIAWSAGAMALTTRVVLFHDRAAHEPAQSEVLDRGLGVVPGVVLLPHARRRLRTDDTDRMALLAQRFAPDQCVVLDDGITLPLGPGGALPGDARVVAADGRIVEVAA